MSPKILELAISAKNKEGSRDWLARDASEPIKFYLTWLIFQGLGDVENV